MRLQLEGRHVEADLAAGLGLDHPLAVAAVRVRAWVIKVLAEFRGAHYCAKTQACAFSLLKTLISGLSLLKEPSTTSTLVTL